MADVQRGTMVNTNANDGEGLTRTMVNTLANNGESIQEQWRTHPRTLANASKNDGERTREQWRTRCLVSNLQQFQIVVIGHQTAT